MLPQLLNGETPSTFQDTREKFFLETLNFQYFVKRLMVKISMGVAPLKFVQGPHTLVVQTIAPQDVISERLVTWVKSQLLQTGPSYGPYLEGYEKGCPATRAAEDEAEPVAKVEAEAEADAQAPSSCLSPTTAPSDVSHGLVSSSRAIEAEPAPQIPRELS